MTFSSTSFFSASPLFSGCCFSKALIASTFFNSSNTFNVGQYTIATHTPGELLSTTSSDKTVRSSFVVGSMKVTLFPAFNCAYIGPRGTFNASALSSRNFPGKGGVAKR